VLPPPSGRSHFAEIAIRFPGTETDNLLLKSGFLLVAVSVPQIFQKSDTHHLLLIPFTQFSCKSKRYSYVK